MVKAILFDLDGTLTDRKTSLEPFRKGFYRRFKLVHLPYESFRSRFFELDEGGYADRQQVFQALGAEFAISVNVGQLVADYRKNAWINCVTFPGTIEVLKELRTRGYKLGIVTNGIVESQEAKILKSGLDGLVELILISEREQLKKPDPRIFACAAERLGVSVANCVFVGDNPEADIGGARSAGMKTIWFIGDLSWPDNLDIVPDHTLSTLAELLAIEF